MIGVLFDAAPNSNDEHFIDFVASDSEVSVFFVPNLCDEAFDRVVHLCGSFVEVID